MSTALPSAPLASTVVQMGDLVHQGLRASGWGRFERWAAQVTKRFGTMVGWQRSQTMRGQGTWTDYGTELAHRASKAALNPRLT